MAGELRALYETDPDDQAGHRRGPGARGPAPPGRHPRRRRGHHPGAAHRVPPDPAQARWPGSRAEDVARSSPSTRCTASRTSGLLKMDFLGLRNLSVIERTLELIEALHRRVGPTSTTSPSTTPPPSRCSAGATRSACSSSRAGPCARSCARWPPPPSRTSAALVALYRPGPMGANMHTDYADRKNGRKPVDLLPRRPGGDPGPHLRADDLPGAADAGGPAPGRLHARRGRQPPQGHGQEEARAHRQGALQVRGRLRVAAATGRRSARRCSTSSSRSPTTPSTSRTPSATASSPTRPPT